MAEINVFAGEFWVPGVYASVEHADSYPGPSQVLRPSDIHLDIIQVPCLPGSKRMVLSNDRLVQQDGLIIKYDRTGSLDGPNLFLSEVGNHSGTELFQIESTDSASTGFRDKGAAGCMPNILGTHQFQCAASLKRVMHSTSQHTPRRMREIHLILFGLHARRRNYNLGILEENVLPILARVRAQNLRHRH
ncbi:hypothetical protein D9M72_533400 [compost metagenome]